MLCLVAVTLGTPAACLVHAKSQPLQSNVAEVRVSDDDKLIAVDGGAPYSGTLVARGPEIIPLARIAFRGTPMQDAVTDLEASGLILVLPVQGGVPSGRAELHADLHSPKLNAELLRTDAHTLELARALAPTLRVAEATFEAGKLEGTAVLFGPGADAALPLTTYAEASFHQSVLHGAAREYYPGGGHVRREMGFRDGVRSGPQLDYYADGSIERQSTFVEGVPHGEVTESYADGSKREASTFDHGTAVGRSRSWFPNGQLQREVLFDEEGGTTVRSWFSNGKPTTIPGPYGENIPNPPDGVVETYYRSGALRSRTQYVAGIQHGPFEVLYSSGKRWEAGRFDEGQRVGAHKKWWKNGRLALLSTYAVGKLEGDYKRWYASGTLWEDANYAQGKRVGRYQKWWKNGAVAHDYRYVDGKIEGEFRTFYDGGERWAEGRFEGGKPQGTLKRWFPDGRLGYIKHHRDGRAAGSYKRWYADGKPRLEANYVKGRLDGEFRNWLEDGAVYEFATYERGKKIKTTRVEPLTPSTAP